IERSLTLLEHGLGAAHPDLAMQMNNRGDILNALARYRDARETFERARTIWERELGAENRSVAYALTGIGVSYLREGNSRGALEPLERAFAIREAQESEPSRKAETSFALARALWDSSRDRRRARFLAENAQTVYAKVAAPQKLSEVHEWLAR